MDEYYRISDITGKTYNVFETIKILNPSQAAFYLFKKVPIQDIKTSFSKDNNKPILVYYFNREDTRVAYDEWCKQKDNISR